MLVITLSDCPASLRGDLTKWLFEINVGVYVGRVSARVRDELWKRVKAHVKSGRATMVYRTNNAQGMAFRVHNSKWKPINFDGITLMLRPHAEETAENGLREGFSHESQKLIAKASERKQARESKARAANVPESYVVIDLETTGLNENEHEIIELGGLKISCGEIVDHFDSLVIPEDKIPPEITALTGITEAMIEKDGRNIEDALPEFLEFIGDLPLIAHNVEFDICFLNTYCREFGLSRLKNRTIDTLEMSRKLYPKLSHKLSDLAAYFGFRTRGSHRSLCDCENVYQLYMKLIEKL